MAHIEKRRGPGGRRVWRVRVRRKGFALQTRTFDTKGEAECWAAQVEARIAGGTFVETAEAERTALAEALERYRREILPRKRSPAEAGFLARWLKRALAVRSLASIRGKDIAEYIAARERDGVGANTIRLELALLSHVFTVARSHWGMESLVNPVARARGARPKLPRGRDRRLLDGEEAHLLAGCRAYGGPIEAIVAFALETAMRRGEIAAMRWEHLDRARRVLHVPETKTGVPRRVPLSSRALAVLGALAQELHGKERLG